jgi:uncharacterized membrane protein YphA (DoxX/SURF4 family)
MSMAALIVRVLLACVFAVAGASKLADPHGSRNAARGFGIPEPLVPAVAVSVPVVEIAIGGSLLFLSAAVPWAAAAALLVLLGFIIAIAIAMAKGKVSTVTASDSCTEGAQSDSGSA